MAAGHKEIAGAGRHPVFLQQVGEDVEVEGAVGSGVLPALVEVGESAPLALFVADVGGGIEGLSPRPPYREGAK